MIQIMKVPSSFRGSQEDFLGQHQSAQKNVTTSPALSRGGGGGGI